MNKLISIFFSTAILFSLFVLPAQASSARSVDLRIQTPSGELYSGWVSVNKNCTVTDSDGVEHELTDHVALCALQAYAEQEGKQLDIENSSYGLFLSGIGKYDQDADLGWYWLFRVNDVSPYVGLDTYSLEESDALLMTLGVWPAAPVALSLSTVDLVRTDEVTATVTAFNDETGEYEPLAEAAVYAGKSEYEIFTTDEKGQATLTFSKKGDYTVFATKQDYTTSEVTHVRVRAANDSSEFLNKAQRRQLLTGALNWLTGQVDEDGKIESIGITEWAAMAFGRAEEDIPKRMRQAILSYDPDKTSATDLERHILALVAVNGNPHDQAGENYVQQLYNNHVHDEQVGDEAYLNDDIFGLLALLKAGQNPNSKELKQVTRFILSHQLSDGSFSYSTSLESGDADTTAAALRALKLAKKKGSVVELNHSINQALDFLGSVQRLDGGFAYDSETIDSNSASTAWVSLGLAHSEEWKINKRHPWTYIAWANQGDGSFAWMVGLDGDALTTAYVAEALAASL